MVTRVTRLRGGSAMQDDMEPEVIGGPSPSSNEEEVEAPETGSDNWIWMMGALLLGISLSALVALGVVYALPVLLAGMGESTVVAARTIPAGTIINSSDVKTVSGSAIPGAPKSPSEVMGRVAEHVIYIGDPVYSARTGNPGRMGGEDAVDASSGRSAWLKADASISGLSTSPGQRVSIWTLPSLGESQRVATDAVVLSQEGGVGSGEKLKVWLTGHDAEALTKARSMGVLLGVVLRSEVESLPESELGDVSSDAATGKGPFRAVSLIPAGQAIQASDLIQIDAESTVPDGDDPSLVVGRLSNRTILPGEEVSAMMLVATPGELQFAARLAAGERAVSLAIGESPIELFEVGSTVDLLEVGAESSDLALQTEIIGLTETGAGCPCTVLKVSEDKAAEVLLMKSRGRLGMRFKDE